MFKSEETDLFEFVFIWIICIHKTVTHQYSDEGYFWQRGGGSAAEGVTDQPDLHQSEQCKFLWLPGNVGAIQDQPRMPKRLFKNKLMVSLWNNPTWICKGMVWWVIYPSLTGWLLTVVIHRAETWNHGDSEVIIQKKLIYGLEQVELLLVGH